MVAFNKKTEGGKQVSTHLSPRGNRTNSGQVHSVWVGVSAPQNAPTSLSATPANTSVSIAFTPPTDNGGMDINNYQYAISSNGGSTYSAYAALSPADGVSPITVTGLTQNTAYLIKLKAVNDVGVSDVESSPVSFTSQGVPTSAPTSLSAIQANTSVAISFTAAASSTALTNYEYSFNNSTWTALSPADAVSPVTISGLTQNTAYTVYLRGVNSYGSGPGSTGVSFTTEGVPTGTPTITSIPVGTTTATVNFTYPGGGGAVTGYDVYVANQTNAWNNAGVSVSPISITGLIANTTYTFYVRAKNAYGVGPQSAGVNATTAPVAEYLVVGGGGAGSGYGGGGGGGYVEGTQSLGGTLTVTVGGGGSGSSGGNSVFGIATGNGGGLSGTTGGSGGGGSGGTNQTSPSGGTGYGNVGGAHGTGANYNLGHDGAGGGGGAGGAGGAGAANQGGNGGSGRASSITGSSVARAGGGGGHSHRNGGGTSQPVGGAGGGGNGSNYNYGGTPSTGGTANTGGGGGCASDSGGVTTGGSGIVIIAYPSTSRAITSISAGLAYSVSTVSRAGYRVYTFTGGTGTVTW
jgi:hypothetical protein